MKKRVSGGSTQHWFGQEGKLERKTEERPPKREGDGLMNKELASCVEAEDGSQVGYGLHFW